MAATSATNTRYQNNITPSGLLSTRSLRDQPRQQSHRTMSLTGRSSRPLDSQPRTMSLSMRTNSINNANRRYQNSNTRTMSMTSSNANIRPQYINGSGSRTNSLNSASISRQQYQQPSNQQRLSRTSSRNNSRAHSLNSNSLSHTKIIKTTKEKDADGRTKSITTTTIEKRGDVKIVRTTVIQPSISQPIDEDVELEELAELEDFDHDNTIDDLHYNHQSPAQHSNYSHTPTRRGQNYFDHFDHDFDADVDLNEDVDLVDQNNYLTDQYYEDPMKNGAALAAAAALSHKSPNRGYSQHHHDQEALKLNARQTEIEVQKQRQLQIKRQAEIQQQQAQLKLERLEKKSKKIMQSRISTQESPNQSQFVTPTKKSEVRFHDDEAFGSDFDQNEQYDNAIYDNFANDKVVESFQDPVVAEAEVEEIMVVTPEIPQQSTFDIKARNRLSEIQEVSEIYDDSMMEEPIENKFVDKVPAVDVIGTIPPNLVAPKVPVNNSMSSFNSSEDNFVEAQENFSNDPPAITNINERVNQNQYVSNVATTPKTEAQNQHSYRNLLVNGATKSPASNNIPQQNYEGDYIKEYGILTPPGSNGLVDLNSKPVVQQKQPQQLKSALKTSASSIASPASEPRSQITNLTPIQPKQKEIVKGPDGIESGRAAMTPDEMYMIALKAAEKKVYGDKLNQVYPDPDIDDNTKLNTIVNTNLTSPQLNDDSVSKPGGQYQSNATGLGFKVHSLRDGHGKPPKVNSEESNKLKKLFKQEQKQQKKQWKEERRENIPDDLLKKVAAKVERDVNMMPVDPNVELQMMQKEQDKFFEEQERIANQPKPEVVPSQQPEAITDIYATPNAKSPVDHSNVINVQEKSPTSVPKVEKSPSKLNLKLFRLTKKKTNTTKPQPGHRKNDSIVSQETEYSNLSLKKQKSNGSSEPFKKNKFFSFGNNNNNNVQKSSKEVPKVVENVEPVVATPVVQNEIYAQPVINNNDIHTIPEDANSLAGSPIVESKGQTIANESFTQPVIPGINDAPKTDNNGSIEGLENTRTTNVDSIATTNSSKIASVAENLPSSTHTPNTDIEDGEVFIDAETGEEAEVKAVPVKPIEPVVNEVPAKSSSKTKASTKSSTKSKKSKGENKFMKFFNL